MSEERQRGITFRQFARDNGVSHTAIESAVADGRITAVIQVRYGKKVVPRLVNPLAQEQWEAQRTVGKNNRAGELPADRKRISDCKLQISDCPDGGPESPERMRVGPLGPVGPVGPEPTGGPPGVLEGLEVPPLLEDRSFADDEGEKGPNWIQRTNEFRAKLTEEQFRLAQLQRLELEGKLHRAEDVEAVIGGVIYAFRSRALGLPSKVAPVIAGLSEPAAVEGVLSQEIEEMLSELARYDARAIEAERIRRMQK